MTPDPNSPQSGSSPDSQPAADLLKASNASALGNGASASAKSALPNSVPDSTVKLTTSGEFAPVVPTNPPRQAGLRSPDPAVSAARHEWVRPQPPRSLLLLLAIAVMMVGLAIDSFWMGMAGAIVALIIALQMLWVPLNRLFTEFIPESERTILLGSIFGGIALLGLLKLLGFYRWLGGILGSIGWDIIGTVGEVLGALGQILIAVLAAYIAWRQYIISRDLTIQQNTITQQQTIDTYFQGVSDLVLDEEGLLEDWPQERAIAEGRTAAILSSVDASGKAKIIRFLSRARLLTPLRRDRRLGRPILDGGGGYEEDRLHGVRVIDLGVMLAGANVAGTDLRWTDLSEANLIRADLSRCDLVKTNFSRTILCDAKLCDSDLNGTRFFYGKAENATPRSRIEPPDYRTGKHTGAVIENADLTGAEQMSEEQRQYFCAWGGSLTRSTVPGGCEGIPNKLGR